jgi:outer membrane lipoprotein-sorting protein
MCPKIHKTTLQNEHKAFSISRLTLSIAVLGLLLFNTPGMGMAQAPALEERASLGTQTDPEARALLAKVKAKYAAYKAMQMDFVLEIMDLETKDTETREGRFAVAGEAFRFSMSDGGEDTRQVLVCDGQTLWTYMEAVNEVQINDWEPDQQDFMSPAELFDLPESDYIALSGERSGSGTATRQAIELSPLDRDLEIHKIRLIIDPNTGALHEAVVMDRNAIHFRYRIENFEGNPTLPSDHFRFDPDAMEDITVVDLR